MNPNHKALENRVRRILARKDYLLSRSRARHEDDPTKGLYHIVNDRNVVVEGASQRSHELTLEQAAYWAERLPSLRR